MEETTQMSKSYKSESSVLAGCARQCSECYEICVRTLQYCIIKGGRHINPAHLSTLSDCVCICATSADFLFRESNNHIYTCRACSEICNACAESCEGMAADDAQMRICAEICRKCADSCDKMSVN